MTDELAGLMARATQLEQENEALRRLQSPGGDDLDLRCENAMLAGELDTLRARRQGGPAQDASTAAGASRPSPESASDQPPRSLAEFNALPAERRRQLAGSMTRAQRDELLGRKGLGGEAGNYL